MAKMYGLSGILRGKMGNVVFSVKNGTQVARQYQPVVSNPKSDLQVEQRRKVILAGKLSHAFKADLLEGIGASSVAGRRALFLKNLLNSITTATVNNNESAVLQAGSLVIANGVSGVFASRGSGLVIDSGTVNIDWLDAQNVYQEGYTQRLRVVVLYMLHNSNGDVAITDVNEVNLATRLTSFTIPQISASSGQIFAWGIPIVGTRGDVWNVEENQADTSRIYNSSGLSSLSSLIYADSVFLGAIDYSE